MTESLLLFESVINSRWFLCTPIILFLNKIDVFKHKLPKVHISSIHSDAMSNYYLSRCPLNGIFPSTLAAQTSTKQ